MPTTSDLKNSTTHDGFAIEWGTNPNGTTPRCSCGRAWCKHIAEEIRAGLDAICFRLDADRVRVLVPLTGVGGPVVLVLLQRVPDNKLLLHVSLFVRDQEVPCGFVSASQVGRLALRDLAVPSLVEWLIENPCACGRPPDLDELLACDASEPARYVRATLNVAILAAERLPRADPDKCKDCDNSDLIPDMPPATPRRSSPS